jgi:CheY-like chemotaxis protein
MRKILIVEDEPILREVYTTILTSGLYIVDAAANGQEALRFCQKHEYDLILLDLMMPVVDGVEFLRRSQLATKAPDTKIILFSNLSMGDNLDKAMKLGAHRHILKSELSPRQLLATVRYELTAK